MTKLTILQSISVLAQAAKIGQSKGAYSLEDAALISQAIKTLLPDSEKSENSEKSVEKISDKDKESVSTKENSTVVQKTK